MKTIADTGLLVARVRENDQYHGWAAEVAEQISWLVLTCEAVLAETPFHLQSSEEVLGMLRDKIVRVAFDCESDQNTSPLWQRATPAADPILPIYAWSA